MKQATVFRYPTQRTNRQTFFCSVCEQDGKTHGYWIFDTQVMSQAVFVCDQCLAAARKAHTPHHTEPL